jgi:hypothetical protein
MYDLRASAVPVVVGAGGTGTPAERVLDATKSLGQAPARRKDAGVDSPPPPKLEPRDPDTGV